MKGSIEKSQQPNLLNIFSHDQKGSQIGAWVSHQSQVISSRSLLRTKIWWNKKKIVKGAVPFPDFLGGYIIKPIKIEFWQGGQDRLHDRFIYELQKMEIEYFKISSIEYKNPLQNEIFWKI